MPMTDPGDRGLAHTWGSTRLRLCVGADSLGGSAPPVSLSRQVHRLCSWQAPHRQAWPRRAPPDGGELGGGKGGRGKAEGGAWGGGVGRRKKVGEVRSRKGLQTSFSLKKSQKTQKNAILRSLLRFSLRFCNKRWGETRRNAKGRER